MSINYEGRVFRPVVNSPHGQVTNDTEFRYQQDGNLLSATYSGGGIRMGQILGVVSQDGSLRFHYQHLTEQHELRSGVCVSTPEQLPDGRIRLHESWEWLSGDKSTGSSIVEESCLLKAPGRHSPEKM